MCEPTSLLITRCVSRVLRMLFLKSSQFIPCPETAFSSSSMLASLFSVRMASSFLMSSGSTLTPMSLARCTRRDWSTRVRRVFFWPSSMAICNCSGVQRFWHSDLASSAALWRALSYSERVMISLLTRAIISSTVFPLSGLAVFGAAGFAGFSDFASGAAIPGFSRAGPATGFG